MPIPIKPHVPKRKQGFYFPNSIIAEMEEEGRRLERPISWLIQRAWRVARTTIQNTPPDPKSE